MPSISDYPAVRDNPDRQARIEDCLLLALAMVSLREAQQFLLQWARNDTLTTEQQAVMFHMLEMREREEAA